MTVLSTLCNTKPVNTHGVPTGIPDWNLSVEVIMPSDVNSLLGEDFILGTSVLAELGWYDLTDRMRGIQIERGGTAGDRFDPGTCTIEFDNEDTRLSFWTSNDAFLSTKNPYLGVGAIIRVAACDIVGGFFWSPMFTGIVEQWDDTTEAIGTTRTLTVTLVETISVLAQTDDNALEVAVGDGETPDDRIVRLADAANWQFPKDNDLWLATSVCQETNMSQNRLTELYLTADSVGGVLYSGRGGGLVAEHRNTGASAHTAGDYSIVIGTPGTLTNSVTHTDVFISEDDFVTVNNDDLLISKVGLARVGGSVVEYENTYLSSRYQKRSYTRNDFITKDPGSDSDLRAVADSILNRSMLTYRPDSYTVDGKSSVNALNHILRLDLNTQLQSIVNWSTNVQFIDFDIVGYTTRIAPMNDDALDMTAEVRLAPSEVSHWNRVYPDATPPANDAFADATAIDVSAVGSIVGNNAGSTDSNRVWYKFTPSVTGSITLATDLSPQYDATIKVYTGATIGAAVLVGTASSGGPLVSAVKVQSVTSGVEYHVSVTDDEPYHGSDFVLRWSKVA